jgi:hypothetical protein
LPFEVKPGSIEGSRYPSCGDYYTSKELVRNVES